MKKSILFVQLFCAIILLKGQPLSTRSIKIYNIIKNNDTLYFKPVHKNSYKEISKQEKDSIDKVSGWVNLVYMPVNITTCLMVSSDTMCINPIFDKYSPISFEIKRLYFKKGTFIINLRECKKEYFDKDSIPINILIEDFPNECMNCKRKKYDR